MRGGAGGKPMTYAKDEALKLVGLLAIDYTKEKADFNKDLDYYMGLYNLTYNKAYSSLEPNRITPRASKGLQDGIDKMIKEMDSTKNSNRKKELQFDIIPYEKVKQTIAAECEARIIAGAAASILIAKNDKQYGQLYLDNGSTFKGKDGTTTDSNLALQAGLMTDDSGKFIYPYGPKFKAAYSTRYNRAYAGEQIAPVKGGGNSNATAPTSTNTIATLETAHVEAKEDLAEAEAATTAAIAEAAAAAKAAALNSINTSSNSTASANTASAPAGGGTPQYLIIFDKLEEYVDKFVKKPEEDIAKITEEMKLKL